MKSLSEDRLRVSAITNLIACLVSIKKSQTHLQFLSKNFTYLITRMLSGN